MRTTLADAMPAQSPASRRCGTWARASLSRHHQLAKLLDGRRPDPGHSVQFLDRPKGAVLRSIVEDLLGGHRADPGQSVQLLERRRAQADGPGRAAVVAPAAGTPPPMTLRGTSTCCPSASGAARFRASRSAFGVAPPARSIASATREPSTKRYSPGRRTAPATSTMSLGLRGGSRREREQELRQAPRSSGSGRASVRRAGARRRGPERP